ncbi:MAG: thiosulfate oxidation carrier complex protein SoxZ [Gammaproteobacteria bacterium]|nr:thiosulfate oxidation carrier complex protein SoxZ [Gammaproteobacteria bacterium]
MAKKSIKIRAKVKDDVVTVKALMTHPMETGARKDKSGELIPAHFIQEVTCEYGEKKVVEAQWSGGVSKNPYLSFKFKGASKGDKLTLSWVDNKGNSDTTEAEIR